MLTAVALLLTLILPAYVVMIRWPSPPVVYGAVALLSALLGFCAGPTLIAITESLPKASRSGALGTLYAVSLAVFGRQHPVHDQMADRCHRQRPGPRLVHGRRLGPSAPRPWC